MTNQATPQMMVYRVRLRSMTLADDANEKRGDAGHAGILAGVDKDEAR